MSQPSGPTLDELDRLAAEKIFGWRWTEVAFIWDDKPRMYLLPPEDWWRKTTSGDWNEHGVCYGMPSPTRNIAQAFECIEEMADDRWLVTLYAGAQDKSAAIHRYDQSFYEFGQTLAEAIVKACLKAKGINV